MKKSELKQIIKQKIEERIDIEENDFPVANIQTMLIPLQDPNLFLGIEIGKRDINSFGILVAESDVNDQNLAGLTSDVIPKPFSNEMAFDSLQGLKQTDIDDFLRNETHIFKQINEDGETLNTKRFKDDTIFDKEEAINQCFGLIINNQDRIADAISKMQIKREI